MIFFLEWWNYPDIYESGYETLVNVYVEDVPNYPLRMKSKLKMSLGRILSGLDRCLRLLLSFGTFSRRPGDPEPARGRSPSGDERWLHRGGPPSIHPGLGGWRRRTRGRGPFCPGPWWWLWFWERLFWSWATEKKKQRRDGFHESQSCCVDSCFSRKQSQGCQWSINS